MVKNLPANARDEKDVGLIPGLGRSPGGGHDNLLQYACLENPTGRGAWRATVHGVTESDRTEATWHTSTHTEADLILGRKFISHCRFLGREAAARQSQPSERRTGKTEY